MAGRVPQKAHALPLFSLLLLGLPVLALAGTQSVPSAAGGSPPGKEAEGLWSPPRDKYLLAICLFGRLTNQVICMRNYLKLAQALNRTLLIPTLGTAFSRTPREVAYDFPWNVPVDWGRMRACLAPHHGPRTVLAVRDYLAENPRNPKVLVTFFQSLLGQRNWAYPANMEMQRFQELNQLELELPPRGQVPDGPLLQGVGKSLPVADVVRAGVRVEDEVMTVGELFASTPLQGLPPLQLADEGCSNLWHAHPGIMEFVDGVIGSVLGDRNYAALHLRRGDFYTYMSDGGKIRGPDLAEKRGFPSIVGFAKEMREKMLSLNFSKLFVATNARKMEVNLFKAVLAEPIYSSVQTAVSLGDVLERKEWVESQPWAKAALEMEKVPGTNGLVLSLIDKFLCVKAAHFWGTSGSTFSLEVGAILRRDEHV